MLTLEQRRLAVLRRDLLGDERQEGMQQTHDLGQQPARVPAGLRLLRLVLAVQPHLDELQIPVAELVPDEVIQRVDGRGEIEDA